MSCLHDKVLRKTHKSNRILVTLSLALLGTTSCTAITERNPEAAVNLETPYKNTNTENTVQFAYSETKWWHLYQDEELNTLMEYAFQNNPTIAQTRARLRQAQAAALGTTATLLPNANISAERNTQNGNNTAPSEFSLVGAASFELDLWGKNSAQATAADLDIQANAEDLHTAYISLTSSIIEQWLQLLSLIEQEKLAKKQIAINNTVLELQQKRFEMGAASALDILQQKQILAESESTLPDIISNQKQTANAIAYLLGDVPREALKVSEKPLPAPLPIPQTGLPSNLLADRPDVMAAWLRLRSADWSAQAAWANRLPSFTLSANAATSAGAIIGLFETWILDMAVNMAAPVFDGGERKAQELQQRALADERYHAYRETVLGAVRDVEDALVRNTYQDQKLETIADQLDTARQTLEQAQITYINGQSSYINVLSALKSVQSLEQQIVREKLAQSIERIGLYRALGGHAWAKEISKSYVE